MWTCKNSVSVLAPCLVLEPIRIRCLQMTRSSSNCERALPPTQPSD